MSEFAWICLNKQDSDYAVGPKHAEIMNMAKFRIWQGSQYDSVTQRSGYARICLDRVLNISWVLNMPGLWIWQGSEYVRVTQGSKYVTMWICLNMSKFLIIGRVLNIYYTIHNTRSLYKFMNAYWEIDVFRTRAKI